MPRVPFAQDQIGEMARIKYETDALCFLRLMGDRGLVASALYKSMGLARGAIREAFAELADYRARQVVPGSIICATRFKMTSAPSRSHGASVTFSTTWLADLDFGA